MTVSAGADLRTMNLAKAKTDRKDKIDQLTTIKSKFTATENQTAIQTVIDDLSATNIESKITDKSNSKKDNSEQHGNRYLIGARIAEGFIKVLNNLTLNPEPTLTLKIDRTNCVIGKSGKNADVDADRDITMNLSLTVEASTTAQVNTQTNANTTATGTST